MRPKRLNFGDTIGVICPASPEEKTSIEMQLLKLRSKGFKIKEGKHLYDRYGYLAGKDEDRASDFMEMFLDNDVSAIICYRGGYGTMRILNFIDFDIIKEHPKIFVGYSDITTLLNQITSGCGLITFHGPMVSSNLDDTITFESLFYTLTQGTSPYIINSRNFYNTSYSGSGSAEGVLAGGNLSLLCSTLGTPYEINTADKILFIEDVGECPYKVDRMLTQLLLSGKLQACSGIILGQFTECFAENTNKSLTLDEVISDRILSLNKPTILNFMSGHDYPKLTLPIGANIRINCDCERLEVLEGVVE